MIFKFKQKLLVHGLNNKDIKSGETLKGCPKKNAEVDIWFNSCHFCSTNPTSWSKFSKITLCGTCLRFGKVPCFYTPAILSFCFHHYLRNISIIILNAQNKIYLLATMNKVQSICFKTSHSSASGFILPVVTQSKIKSLRGFYLAKDMIVPRW